MNPFHARTRAPRDWSSFARRRALPRFLFAVTCLAAVALLALVIVAPFLIPADPDAQGWQRLLVLFGHDPTLRRTAIASSVGLVATACIFFREHDPEYRRLRRRRLREPPPPTIAGA